MNALIINDIVVDLSDNKFEVSKSFTWVDCDSKVKVGDIYTSNKFERKFDYTAIQVLRQDRNGLLNSSDSKMMRANEINSKIEQWKKYRQDLRDLPSTSSPKLDENGILINVTFPTEPS